MLLEVCANGKLAVSAGGKIKPCGCDPSCCMYSADGLLAGDFTAADLPESLSLLSGSGSATKSVSHPVYYTGTDGTNPLRISILEDFSEPPTHLWQIEIELQTQFGTGWIPAYWDGPCLISGDGNLTPGDDTVEDQFEVNYSIGSDTVTRTSLCVWSGAKTGGGTWTLKYNSVTYKWNLNGTEKTSGNQSTPTGTYTAGTVS